MKIALINGSPKPNSSASSLILKDLGSLLSEHEVIKVRIRNPVIKEEDMDFLLSCEVLVFAFPLYVDGIPSHLLSVLEKIEVAKKNEKQDNSNQDKVPFVYALVNSGFYESKQNSIAIEMMKNFAKRAGFCFGQGVGIGAGGMISSLSNVPLGHGPKKNYGVALCEIAENIEKKETGDTLFPKMNFPKFFYTKAAQMGWRKTIKQNGLKRKDINRQL